jgi:hypothetical protein
VFTGGLHAPSSATVVRADGMITDGPYLEGKEHIGGIWVITGPDLDALRWGRKAAAATTLPIEVCPFQTSRPSDAMTPEEIAAVSAPSRGAGKKRVSRPKRA